jgi:hypothetical protein
MKHTKRYAVWTAFAVVLSVLMLMPQSGWAQQGGGSDRGKTDPAIQYKVEIVPADVTVQVGGEVDFKAFLADNQGSRKETQCVWSFAGRPVGILTQQGHFKALTEGKGLIVATAGKVSGKAHVAVEPDSVVWKPKRPAKRLVVLPKDTLVAVGGTVKYAAVFIDTAGVQTQAAVAWDLVAGRPIGSISSGGEFKALFEGVGTVRARTTDKYTAMARVRVGRARPAVNSDSIKFHFRDKNNNRIGSIHSLSDKDVLKISGLPFPLNILNGGEVALPPGSLGSNVSIDVTLPGLAQLKGDSTVDFLKNVLTGISFHVFVDGKEISPFFFPTPVQVVLPYKADLMARLGLTPENLWAFFSTPSGGFDSTGVSSVVVDTMENKIIITVSHFSDIVLANKNAATVTGVQTQNVLPGACRLYENYPNPFNPETRIRFDVAGSAAQKVRLAVYDMLGRQIRVLADRAFAPGSYDVVWNGKDGSGRTMGTGIYILRMESAEATLTQRMVLMK